MSYGGHRGKEHLEGLFYLSFTRFSCFKAGLLNPSPTFSGVVELFLQELLAPHAKNYISQLVRWQDVISLCCDMLNLVFHILHIYQ